jgi:anti-sigma28 factor (negative regulator of flagellin synthesis)
MFGDAIHNAARIVHHYRRLLLEYGTKLAACDASSLYQRLRGTDGIKVMKISARQVQAVLDSYVRHGREAGRAHIEAGQREPIAATSDNIRRQFEMLPEERDLVVHDLRAKVRSGNYFVSSTEIVDALLGRLAANLIAP